MRASEEKDKKIAIVEKPSSVVEPKVIERETGLRKYLASV